jgi:hypothetical protein
VQRDVAAEPCGDLADQLSRRLGRRNPERVDDDRLLCAGLGGGLVGEAEEVVLRTRPVDPEVGDADTPPDGERDRATDPLQHRLPGDAVRLELEVGDRALDHRGVHAELYELLDVRLNCAGEAPDLGRETCAGDQLDRAPVVLRDARETGFDAVDPEPVECACQLELLLGVENDPDRLLAVAQRGVVQPHAPAQLVRTVDLAGPDHRTTPSGKGDSFCAPSAVIRKLSSRRSPPPPSQYAPGSIASTILSSIVPPPA